MNPEVQGYAAAVLDEVAPDERPALAQELAAVSRLVVANAELHAAMTDVAVAARARRGVLEDVLDSKVSGPARRIAGYAAGAVHAQEVAPALAWVANRARQVAEGVGETAAVLGHRDARRRVGGYAARVFEELSAHDLEEVEDELFRFARIVGGTAALRGALSDRDLPAAERQAIVVDLLAGKASVATVRLAGYAVSGGRPRDVVGTLDWLVEQAAEARGWRIARVRAGQDVDAEERAKLEQTLSRLAGSPVELQVTVDPSLLAGVNVEIGDLQLDSTARGRLDRLRDHVLTGGWQDQGFGRMERAAHAQGSQGQGGAGRGSDPATGAPDPS